MATWPGRGADAVQCMRITLRQVDAQDGSQQGAIDGVESKAEERIGRGISEQPLTSLPPVSYDMALSLGNRIVGRSEI